MKSSDEKSLQVRVATGGGLAMLILRQRCPWNVLDVEHTAWVMQVPAHARISKLRPLATAILNSTASLAIVECGCSTCRRNVVVSSTIGRGERQGDAHRRSSGKFRRTAEYSGAAVVAGVRAIRGERGTALSDNGQQRQVPELANLNVDAPTGAIHTASQRVRNAVGATHKVAATIRRNFARGGLAKLQVTLRLATRSATADPFNRQHRPVRLLGRSKAAHAHSGLAPTLLLGALRRKVRQLGSTSSVPRSRFRSFRGCTCDDTAPAVNAEATSLRPIESIVLL